MKNASDFSGAFLFLSDRTCSMAGYSGTPLQKKLGIKSGMMIFVSEPPELYFDWISPMPDNITVSKKLVKDTDFIHLFARDQKSFKTGFQHAKKHLDKAGALWISWPKKSSKVSTDLDENIIREYGLSQGLVDVKVCAIDDTWSGLKFVFRVKDR
jgi:hypothetical protein